MTVDMPRLGVGGGQANCPLACLEGSYQSPLLSPLARELEWSLLFAFPAAADAKLEVNGDGMAADRCRSRKAWEQESIGWNLQIDLWELKSRLGSREARTNLQMLNGDRLQSWEVHGFLMNQAMS